MTVKSGSGQRHIHHVFIFFYKSSSENNLCYKFLSDQFNKLWQVICTMININCLCISEFLQWKDKIEEETSSSYISKSQVAGKSEVYKYYECCRSGKYVANGKRERLFKS